jgi:hypothetical protein
MFFTTNTIAAERLPGQQYCIHCGRYHYSSTAGCQFRNMVTDERDQLEKGKSVLHMLGFYWNPYSQLWQKNS